jgi:hypothetical protein
MWERESRLKWQLSNDGYVIYTGTAPVNYIPALGCTMQMNIISVRRNATYYFQIEAINENDESERTRVVKVE